MGFKASVLGASGYAGGELLRLLDAHPALSVVAVGAHSQVDSPVSQVHPHLEALMQPFSDNQVVAGLPVEVCFSCLPSGVGGSLFDEVDARLIIDLSDDHRDSPLWAYGLTEHARTEIAGAARVANPGCYPTATLLGLVPLVRAGVAEGPVIVDALSGISGAGKGLGDSMSFSALHGNASAYGSVSHRHVPEIERGLASLGGRDMTVSFTPHLIPLARGLLVTARASVSPNVDSGDVLTVLHGAYDKEPFVTVTSEWPSTKAVLGTNRALISARVDERAGFVIVSVAIDNLGKGAAGQAVQNANVALGLDETCGLEQVAVWP